MALFTFVGDVAVHQVKMKGEELIHRLMKWSLKYLVEHVCRWVQEAGGWVSGVSGFSCFFLFNPLTYLHYYNLIFHGMKKCTFDQNELASRIYYKSVHTI